MRKNEIKENVKNQIDRIEDERLLWMIYGTVNAAVIQQEVDNKTE